MIVLDTNIISEIAKLKCDENVRNWMRKIDPQELHLCAPVIAELSFGAHKVLHRDNSSRFLNALEGLINGQFKGKIIGYDESTAMIDGKIRAQRSHTGKPISIMDCQIAAICVEHGAQLATRNTRDFIDLNLALINPFETEV